MSLNLKYLSFSVKNNFAAQNSPPLNEILVSSHPQKSGVSGHMASPAQGPNLDKCLTFSTQALPSYTGSFSVPFDPYGVSN